MKKLFLSFAYLAIVALAFGQESAMPSKDLSGFSGYAWGTSIDYIISDRASEEFELISSGHKDLWYKGLLADEPMHLVYLFENGMLISGMWIFDEADKESYWKVNNFLRGAYNSSASLKIRGDLFIESEMRPKGSRAWIIHELDIADDNHVVHYYYESGAE